MHDHGTRAYARLPDQQRREVLLDPGNRAPVGLLRACKIVEQADRGHRVIAGIDDVIGLETFDVADDRDGAFLDAARQLLGTAGLGLGLTDGGVHGVLLPVIFRWARWRAA